MSDFENDLRSAVDAATAATVAPPFAAVTRRAQVHRRHQVLAVAAAVSAVLAGAALAVPRIEARDAQPAGGGPGGGVSAGPLKPYGGFVADREALQAFQRCMERGRPPLPGSSPTAEPDLPTVERIAAAEAACYEEAGYAPPPPQGSLTATATEVEDGAAEGKASGFCAPYEHENPKPRSETVHEGRTDLGRWWVAVRDGNQPDHPCVAFRAGEHGWSTDFGDIGEAMEGAPIDRQQFGAVTEDLAWGTYDFYDPSHTAFWGAVSKDADRVVFTVDGVTQTVDAVASDVEPDWRYVAAVFETGYPRDWTVVVYGRDGQVLNRYERS